MENKLERYFNAYKIREELKVECIIEYEKIEKEFKNKDINISDINKNYISQLVLPWVLIDEGYTYAGKYIAEEIRKNKENSYFKIANIVKDIWGVDTLKMDIINPFENKREIIFVKELGLFEEFDIIFSGRKFPCAINYVSNRLEKYIKTEIINEVDRSIVRVKFRIPRYEDVNKLEDIVIYTPYKTKHYSFIVRSESDYLLEGESKGRVIENTIIQKVYKAKNIEEILEIIKIYENETERELPVDVYVKILKHAFSYREFNVRLALFCEEFFLRYPIVFDGILEYLRELYNKKIITDNSDEIIDYMKLVLDDSITSKGALINLKEFKGEIDSEFINEVKYIYKSTENKDIFNLITNKIINSNGVKFDCDLVMIIYDFYKRTKDIRGLMSIIKNSEIIKLDIEDLEFNINDRVLLLEFYKRNKVFDFKYIVKFSYPYIEESVYIKKSFIYILKEMLNNNSEEDLLKSIKEYRYVFEKIAKYDDEVYLKYIEQTIEEDFEGDIELLKNAINKFNSIKYRDLRLKLIRKIIKTYVLNGEEEGYIKYINIYLESYEMYDNSNLIFEIIEDNKEDIILLSIIASRVNFKKTEDKKISLLNIKDIFIKNNRYDLLISIMYGLKELDEYNECFKLLKKYISNSKYITEKIYTTLIKVVFDNIETKDKKQLFDLLVIRDDLTVEFRIKCLNIFKNEDNEKYIIDAFKKGKTLSKRAKELTIRNIYNDDFEFLKYICIGKNNEEIKMLVINKCIDKFKDDKEYIVKLLKLFNEESKMINLIKKYIKEYYYYKNNTALQYIFGNYTVVSRFKGEVCDRVKLKGIFSEELADGIIFKEEKLKSVIEKYLNINNIKYEFMDSCLVFKNNEKKDICVQNEVLEPLIKIIKFNKAMLSNGYALIDFNDNSFVRYDENIFPSRIERLVKYRENRLIIKEDLSEKTNKITLTEEKLVLFTKKYFYGKLLKLRDKNRENIILTDFIIEEIIKNKDIKTFRRLKDSLELIVDKDNNMDNIEYDKLVDEYKILSLKQKKKLINTIIDKDDTRKKCKDIIINSEVRGNKKEEYIKYLMRCFNNHHFDISIKDKRLIYSKILNSMKNNKYLKEKYKKELEEIIKKAPERCEIEKNEVYKQLYFNNIIDKI